jgi:hypothetical protein
MGGKTAIPADYSRRVKIVDSTINRRQKSPDFQQLVGRSVGVGAALLNDFKDAGILILPHRYTVR